MWRSVMQYHPIIGYTFIPGIKARTILPNENLGYLIKVNEQGFRCNHDFVSKRLNGQFRALLFGDSQTAGERVPNHLRYGDQLEKLITNLQVYNFGLPGTGMDQQYLVYQEYVRNMEHDLLILGVHVENIGRVAGRYRLYTNDKGEQVIYAKPYYILDNGKLVLKHVPVPKGPIQKSSLDPHETAYVDWGVPFPTLRKIAKGLGIRDFAQKVTRFQPIPDYKNPHNPKWIIMRAILEEWIRSSQVPVLLIPIPIFTCIEQTSDPTHYQARFREVAQTTSCMLHDPLPDLVGIFRGRTSDLSVSKRCSISHRLAMLHSLSLWHPWSSSS